VLASFALVEDIELARLSHIRRLVLLEIKSDSECVVRHTAIFLSFLITSSWAYAADNLFCNPNDTGNATLVAAISSQQQGSVTAGDPVKFIGPVYGQSANCQGASCTAHGGVKGVLLHQSGSKVCVGLPGKGKLNTVFGWIPAARWRSTTSEPQPIDQWIGVWQNQSGKITIQRGDGTQLHVVGAGIWGGGSNVHFGDFDITDTPQDGVFASESYGCQIAIRIMGDYLVAADNGRCGALNVRFNGMYRLRHR
jgi:hypothetical protein